VRGRTGFQHAVVGVRGADGGRLRRFRGLAGSEPVDLDDDESVLASVDVSLESDSIDWDDWNDAEETENEDGARDFAHSGHETYDNYVSLAWERYVEDSASLWAKELLDTHSSRQREDEKVRHPAPRLRHLSLSALQPSAVTCQ
jgi:hypothetical protein